MVASAYAARLAQRGAEYGVAIGGAVSGVVQNPPVLGYTRRAETAGL
jgi:hypothetical protein